MKKQRDLSRYFSGSRLGRQPLAKLIAGGLTVALCSCTGLAVAAAAAALPLRTAAAQPVAAAPASAATPEAAVTVELAASPHTPDPALQLEATVVQQDVGVQLYTLIYPQQPVFDDPEDEMAYIPHASEKQPLTGQELTVVLTDEAGERAEYPVDPANGTALAEDVTPGLYTVEVSALAGYTMPAPMPVTVNEKVVYKADTAAVQEKIVQASAVSESQEDSGYSGSVIANEVTDTVPYADSAKEEIGSGVVYTATVSDTGYLVLGDGTVTGYRPLYDAQGALTGAVREGTQAAGLSAAGGIGPSVRYLGRAAGGKLLLTGVEGAVPWEGEPTAPPAEPTAPAQEPAPTASPAAAEEPTAPPPADPAPAEPTAPAPEPAPTEPPADQPAEPPTWEDPAATPTQAPGGTDGTAGWPDSIPADQLAGYGFAVTGSEGTTYRYTGWQTLAGGTYYYHPETHQPVTGTQVIQGNVYEFSADGALNQQARGVDVSKFQGSIDWNAVAADGVSFAIIRCGYRGYGSGALVEDSTFRANIAGATAAGLRVGVYFYGQAINEAEAVEEASMVLSLCGGYSLPLGVYYDTEKVAGDTGRADTITAGERTACTVAFCETIRGAGYTAGVYSYANWFYNALNFANISKYRIWIAQYRDALDFGYGYNIWQYTSTGSVNGIPKPVDMNLG